MREIEKPNDSLVTIEVQNNKVVQSKIKHNKSVDKKQQIFLKKWEEKKLQVA